MAFRKMVWENRWICLFALAFSIIVLILSPAEPLLYDSALYAGIAKSLLREGCYCFNFQPQPIVPPVFPLLEAAFMLAFGEGFMKPMLAFIAGFTALSSYLLALRISSRRRTALITSVLFMSTPLVIYNSLLPLMDLLFSGMVMLSLWSYLAFMQKGGKGPLVLCAAITAAAVMTRFVGYVIFPIYIIHFLISRKKAHATAKGLVMMLLLAFAFLAPWNAWRLGIQSNEMKVVDQLLLSGYGNLVFRLESFYTGGEPANVVPISIDMIIPLQAVNFARILATLLTLATPLLAIAFGYFLLRPKRFGKSRHDPLLMIWFFAFMFFHTFFFIYFGSRYLIPFMLPLALVFARYLESSVNRRRLLVISLSLLQAASLIGITYADYSSRSAASSTDIFEKAGLWIKENTPADATLLPIGSPTGALAYYGERKVIGANETMPDFLAESNLAYSPFTLQQYLDETGLAFKEVKAFSDARYHIRIYQRDVHA
jgi:4-amino-4-deoxy-L-arabinose transferase-like glycosyltransferase